MTAISEEQILKLLDEPRTFEQGFRFLMEQYQERLYWHVRRLVGGHEDANDVLQNCFIKVYRSIRDFEKKSKLYTWLYRIATNEAITFLNQKKRLAASSIDDEERHLANQLKADDYMDGEELQQRLLMALELLPEKQRLVFNMRYFDELSYQEMSDVLGTSTGALKASFHHAVKKVEAYIRGD